MTREAIAREIARCDREIEAMQSQPEGEKAYLTTLGINDWRTEKAILQRILTDPAMTDAVAAEAQLGKLTMRPDPNRPGGHINPCTGIPPIKEWGCHFGAARGFVSNPRFGSGQVIPRTNSAQKKRTAAALATQGGHR